MNQNKIKTYIGFAIKSKNAIFGYDKLFEAKKIPQLVLISHNLAIKMLDKVHNFCEDNQIKYVDIVDMDLGELTSKPNCKVIAICDKNLVSAILKELEC